MLSPSWPDDLPLFMLLMHLKFICKWKWDVHLGPAQWVHDGGLPWCEVTLKCSLKRFTTSNGTVIPFILNGRFIFLFRCFVSFHFFFKLLIGMIRCQFIQFKLILTLTTPFNFDSKFCTYFSYFQTLNRFADAQRNPSLKCTSCLAVWASFTHCNMIIWC